MNISQQLRMVRIMNNVLKADETLGLKKFDRGRYIIVLLQSVKFSFSVSKIYVFVCHIVGTTSAQVFGFELALHLAWLQLRFVNNVKCKKL